MSYINQKNFTSTTSQNKNVSYIDDSIYSPMPHDVSIERTIYKFKVILLGESDPPPTAHYHGSDWSF